jgi:hypothetical protein
MARLLFKDEFKLNTIDVVMGAVIGVIEAVLEITGAVGIFERIFFIAGAPGWTLNATYNGATFVLFTTVGYLRRRSAPVIIAATVLALVRWMAGDPDGPLLLYFSVVPVIPAVIAGWLLNWEDKPRTCMIVNGIMTGSGIITCMPVFGFDMMGGPLWAFVAMFVGFIAGGVWGLLAYAIGRGLVRVGISRAPRELELAEA